MMRLRKFVVFNVVEATAGETEKVRSGMFGAYLVFMNLSVYIGQILVICCEKKELYWNLLIPMHFCFIFKLFY